MKKRSLKKIDSHCKEHGVLSLFAALSMYSGSYCKEILLTGEEIDANEAKEINFYINNN